jgi:V8-like Glu-specific endopeptidase
MGTTSVGLIPPKVPAFDADFADEGESIGASGFPLDIPSLVTNVGWVASKYIDERGELLQLGSLQTNEGNSGGPVYRLRDGVVIGIVKGYWNAPVHVNNRAAPQVTVNSGLTAIVPIHEGLDLLAH